jgi:hypothetical protein
MKFTRNTSAKYLADRHHRHPLQGASLVRRSGLTIQQRIDAFVQLISYLISADAVVPIDPTVTQPCPTSALPLNIIADNCGTSVRMIEKTYAKILAAKRRDFIERGAPSLATSRLRAAT